METLADTVLNYSYSPTWNVYVFWLLGFYYCRWVWRYDMPIPPHKSEKHVLVTKCFSMITVPCLGFLHDYIILIFSAGRPVINVYNNLWLGNFLSASQIFGFFGT